MAKKKLLYKPILSLYPTQFGLGMAEVESKVKRLGKLKGKAFYKYIEEHTVPVVCDGQGKLHIVDHHHFTRTCWELGLVQVPVVVIAALPPMSDRLFWILMEENGWVYPYDQLGNGPHSPVALPTTVRGMGDDPYRSLAWAVKEAKGFEKNDEPFFEFKWAKFFRSKISLATVRNDFDGAVKQALKLCKTKHAKKLPGYIGDKNEHKKQRVRR